MKLKHSDFTRAIVVRLFFIAHALLCDSRYWFLVFIPLLLFVECFLTLKYSDGGEWSLFRPCIFIYLASVVPSIWIFEWDLLDQRTAATTVIGDERISLCWVINQMGNSLNGSICTHHITFPDIEEENRWSLAHQQIVLFLIIVAMWLLPRGNMSHRKLSYFLLGQIGVAADILEFLAEGTRKDETKCSAPIVISVLAIWTLSLLQLPFNWDSGLSKRFSLPRGLASARRNHCQNPDVWEVFSVIILQDGPYLVMRLYFLIYLNIFNQALLFFTAKNTLVLLLQCYRLWALTCVTIDEDGNKSHPLSQTFKTVRNRLQGNNASNKDKESDSGDNEGGQQNNETVAENTAYVKDQP